MKLFSHILAFYLVLLSAVPCCAFDNCPDDKIITEKTTGQQSGGDDNDCGSCSPFFNCEGCAFVTTNATPGFFSVIILPASKIYSEFIAAFVADVHYDFWQPPKLG